MNGPASSGGAALPRMATRSVRGVAALIAEEPVPAIAGFGQGVGPKGEVGLRFQQIVDQVLVLHGKGVDVVDDQGALVTHELVVFELPGTLHQSQCRGDDCTASQPATTLPIAPIERS